MTQIRQDAWKEKEDQQLAEIVLQFIRRGKTQLEAFREAAIHLNRTPAACGFRWNANLRKQYVAQLEQIRNEPATVSEPMITDINSETMQLIQKLMKKIQMLDLDAATEKNEINRLKAENSYLKKQLKRYEEGWQEMNRLWEWIKAGSEVSDNRSDTG